MSEQEHVVSRSVYFGIFAGLMVLTGITVWIAFIDLGRMNVLVALTIAVAKATLVLLYFMHLRYGPHLNWVIVGAAFVWFGILLLFTMSDVLTRATMLAAGF